ncbi:unnamed protein product [Sympodiomycopsis kandeliae]
MHAFKAFLSAVVLAALLLVFPAMGDEEISARTVEKNKRCCKNNSNDKTQWIASACANDEHEVAASRMWSLNICSPSSRWRIRSW